MFNLQIDRGSFFRVSLDLVEDLADSSEEIFNFVDSLFRGYGFFL